MFFLFLSFFSYVKLVGLSLINHKKTPCEEGVFTSGGKSLVVSSLRLLVSNDSRVPFDTNHCLFGNISLNHSTGFSPATLPTWSTLWPHGKRLWYLFNKNIINLWSLFLLRVNSWITFNIEILKNWIKWNIYVCLGENLNSNQGWKRYEGQDTSWLQCLADRSSSWSAWMCFLEAICILHVTIVLQASSD